MASLQKRGKTWYIRFTRRREGRRQEIKYSLGVHMKAVAERYQGILETKLRQRQIDPFAPGFSIDDALFIPRDQRPLDLADTLDRFLAGKGHLKRRSRDIYRETVGYFLRFNRLEHAPVSALQRAHFTAFLQRPDVAATTRYYNRQRLRTWWRWIHEQGWDDRMLTDRLTLPPQDAPPILPKMITEPEIRILFKTFDDINAGRRQKKNHRAYWEQPWFKPVVLTLLDAGLRLHECLYNPYQADADGQNITGLKGRNLVGDLEFIYIYKAKRNRERMIPITGRLRAALAAYFRIRGVPDPDEFLFITHRGQPITGHHARKEFNRYLEAAGLPASRTFHGMRHRAVTRWLEQGFTLSEAKDMAGHSSVKITDETYTHLAAQNLKRKLEAIESRNKKGTDDQAGASDNLP